MKYFIITGTSKGLGEAIVEQLIHPNHHLFCISRTLNTKLVAKAKTMNGELNYFEFDLNNIHQISELMKEIFQYIDLNEAEAIYLINNAGIVTPIKPINKADHEEVIGNIHVNLIAPMLLTSSFIQLTDSFTKEKRIYNISSGAGKKPYYGWSAYSSAKAGIDMFTQCVGIEQEERQSNVKIISIAPGVIETNMQESIRATNIEDFIYKERFVQMKEQGTLQTPEAAAKKLIRIFLQEELQNGQVIDIRDFSFEN